MNIDWVIPCRFVEVHDNLGTLVGAGIDTYWVAELPTPIQVVLAVRLTATAEELTASAEHEVRNVVKDPRGEVIGDEGGPFSAGADEEQVRTDWLNGLMLVSVVVLEAAEQGTYTIEHRVDQNSYPVPIHIVHGPPPGGVAE
jgi:hypothetical protein